MGLFHRLVRVRDVGDRGSGTLEYVGVAVLVGVIIAGLGAAMFGQRLTAGASTSVCKVTDTSCTQSTTGAGTVEGAPGGQPSRACNGFWGCTGSGVYHLGKAAVETVTGLVDLVLHPENLVSAGEYIVNHPGDAARQLIWDDETDALWRDGDVGGAAGRTIWNIGSWFIPVSKGSKAGKLGGLSVKVADAARLAQEASAYAKAAAQALARGDLKAAAAAAAKARAAAAEARALALKAGCGLSAPRAGWPPPQVLALGGGGGRLPTGVIIAAGGCGDDAAKAAAAAKEAEEAVAKAEAAAIKIPGVGDKPTKVVNTNISHVDAERATRAGFDSVSSAKEAVKQLGKSIESNGFPAGTIADTARADRVLVPIGDNGYAVYQIGKNGNAVFKTILTAKP
jgi:hypothetical protein